MKPLFQKREYLLFDLDGTLTDPKEGITRSVAYALSKLGIEITDMDTLLPFIGPPLKEMFVEYAGLPESDALRAVEYYRERFQETGIFENILYDGIPELLAKLKGAGKKILLATSKPEVFAKRILEHFSLTSYFDFIGGSTLDHTRDRKEEVIRYVMGCTGITDPGRAVMIGDREHDVLGAKVCGMEAIGVLYGYGSREELELAGAAGIATDLLELSTMLI